MFDLACKNVLSKQEELAQAFIKHPSRPDQYKVPAETWTEENSDPIPSSSKSGKTFKTRPDKHDMELNEYINYNLENKK